jgi:hypothetical protein
MATGYDLALPRIYSFGGMISHDVQDPKALLLFSLVSDPFVDGSKHDIFRFVQLGRVRTFSSIGFRGSDELEDRDAAYTGE